jgi:DNA-directed RNA polymerase subunit F
MMVTKSSNTGFYSVRVGHDYTEKMVKVEAETSEGAVELLIDSKYARKIAIRLLEAAAEVEG